MLIPAPTRGSTKKSAVPTCVFGAPSISPLVPSPRVKPDRRKPSSRPACAGLAMYGSRKNWPDTGWIIIDDLFTVCAVAGAAAIRQAHTIYRFTACMLLSFFSDQCDVTFHDLLPVIDFQYVEVSAL